MQVFELLIAAKAKIDTPEKWTQGTFARDVNARPVSPTDGVGYPNATCFCSIGAIAAAYWAAHEDVVTYKTAIDTLYAVLPIGEFTVPHFNDSATHEGVMGLFDAAIKRAKGLA